MTVNRTTLLDLPIITTGTESGAWGNITNNGLSQYMDIAIAGMTSLTSANFTAGALTIANTQGDSSATNIAAGSAQYATIKVSSLAANSTITAPSSNRAYRIINADGTYTLTIKASGQTGVTFPINTSGIVVFNGTDYVLLGSYVIASAGTASLPSITTTGDTNTGIYFPAADTIAFTEGGVESMRIDSSGNLGLGVTPSAWNTAGKAFEFSQGGNAVYASASNTRYDTSNAYLNSSGNFIYSASNFATFYSQFNGAHSWHTAPSGTAGNTITFTQAMTLDASGNLGIGTTSPGTKLHVTGSNGLFVQFLNSTGNTGEGLSFGSGTNLGRISTNGASTAMAFEINATERARITSGGDLLVGKTVTDITVAGVALLAGGDAYFAADGPLIYVNRTGSDGDLIVFRQANTTEGSISVSGNTVSYNAFAGSHWSQLFDGSKPEILRGTVMESINELVQWPDEPTSERLCRVKVSDTAGSKKVYGVFMDWDNDWTATNDLLVTSLGAFVCRVNADVVVEQGDLLESNGDGTARVQADDVIRSSTIGKVTSTTKTHEYADGSYCVPTVLYCG